MKNFLIVPNLTREKTESLLSLTNEYLERENVAFTVSPDGSVPAGETFDALIFIGGDGTMLRSAHTALELDIPMVGINAGSVGYYSRISAEDLEGKLGRLIRDEYSLEECVLLTHDGKRAVINDAVMMVKGSVASFIVIKKDGREIFRTVSSGLILSTTIGSSGITRSAGGALMDNGLPLLEITPILPNRGDDRSLVIGSDSEISLNCDREAEMNLDGSVCEIPKDDITFRAFGKKLKLVSFQ